ncbi:MAG TPA: hypothetical protein VI197_18320 [Polyangiaceae bacterium]
MANSSDNGGPEKLVRRVALLLVPLLLGAVYLLRSEKPAPPAPGASSATPAPRSPPLPPAAVASHTPMQPFSDETPLRASATEPVPSPPPPPPPRAAGIPAADLPPASVNPSPQIAAPSVPASPCGGLFVRLITVGDDPKQAFASLATSYAAPAQVVHVGDRVGGFRVTKIEWDRVWVQSGGGRCAVGMHFGARDAQEGAAKELSAEDYAKLPWVLPQAIVDGLSKRSEMEFELDVATITALYARGADLFAGLRMKLVDGPGVQLFDIRLDSFLERLGIEEKDVLVAIDEKPVDSVDAVVKALEAAREHEVLTADFTRDGEPYRLTLSLRRVFVGP